MCVKKWSSLVALLEKPEAELGVCCGTCMLVVTLVVDKGRAAASWW